MNSISILCLTSSLVWSDASFEPASVETVVSFLRELDAPCRYDVHAREAAFFFDDGSGGPGEVEGAIESLIERPLSGDLPDPAEVAAVFELAHGVASRSDTWETRASSTVVVWESEDHFLQTNLEAQGSRSWISAPGLILHHDEAHGQLLARSPPIGLITRTIDELMGPLFVTPQRLDELAAMEWQAVQPGRIRVVAGEGPGRSFLEVFFDEASGRPRLAIKRFRGTLTTACYFRYGAEGRRLAELERVTRVRLHAGIEVSIEEQRVQNVRYDVSGDDVRIVYPAGTPLVDLRQGGDPVRHGSARATWPDDVQRHTLPVEHEPSDESPR